ncbi:MAG: hypothetical protein J1E64_00065 [Acetatifactor sp.]|nr:hypothetical protein [Acetatifactor sp.]
MTVLLEFREKVKAIYSRYEAFILPIVKFLLAFVVLTTINRRMGYMTLLNGHIELVLIAALTCSFLPSGGIIFFAALFSLLHMYALSMEVALVGFCLYLLMFLLFFRFTPKDSLVVVLTPLLCAFRVPYVMPVAMGLLGTPVSAVSVGCGVVIYFLFQAVAGNATTIGTLGDEDATAKLRLVIDGMMNNRQMLVMVAAFAITVIVVYLIRRMSVDYAWTIAMIAGVMVDLVILLVGDLLYDTNMSVGWAILGVVLAVVCGKIIEFFRFCVDYSRTEKVQFEDDEYYYYVKAVPKMTVAAPTKTVKKINTQRQGSSSVGRGYEEDLLYDRPRSVVTERTNRNAGTSRTRADYVRNRTDRQSNRSVTANNRAEDLEDDYEELF